MKLPRQRFKFRSCARPSVFLLVLLASLTVNLVSAAPSFTPLGSIREGLRAPAGVAVTASGSIFVSDPQSGSITAYDAFGRRISRSGGFSQPLGISVDPLGQIYVAEQGKACVTVLDSNWNTIAKLGQGDREFILPNHIAFSCSNLTTYVTDSGANLVKAYQNNVLKFQFGGLGTNSSQFDFPAGICIGPAGDVFVVDQNNNRVQVFDSQGAFLRQFNVSTPLGGMGLGSASGRPNGITADALGRIFICDGFQDVILAFDAGGTYLAKTSGLGNIQGKMQTPVGLVIDAFGRLFVASVNTGRLEIFGVDSYIHLSASAPAADLPASASLTLSVSSSDPGPIQVQWTRDSTNITDTSLISGASTPNLTLSNVNPASSGSYSLTLNGTNIGVSAVLDVVITPPQIVSDPQSQLVQLGSAVTLSAIVTGGDPLTCQWRRNGVDIPGQTNAAISIAAASDADAGDYIFSASNSSGSVTSADAKLTINHPPVTPAVTVAGFASEPLFISVSDLLSSATDPDGDNVNLINVSPASATGAGVALEGDFIVCNALAAVADTFTYTVSDGNGGIATGTVFISPSAQASMGHGVIAFNELTRAFSISFTALPNQFYDIQYSTTLQPDDWTSLGLAQPDSSGQITHFEPLPLANSMRFYRVVKQ